MESNPELKLAYDFVQYTNRNIFLTGKAGTGKTTFLHKLKAQSLKRMVVVAPTGVAAINAGGVTIHSFFQMPFGPIIPSQSTERKELSEHSASVHKMNKTKINIIKSLDLLVIDEISMVRADLLDGIDTVLRKYKNKYKPFGGVQLLMIGDLQQLAPVVKEEEWQILKQYYDTVFFFSSKALQQSPPVNIELKHIYRQNDKTFIQILNEIRENNLSPSSIQQLNKRYIPNFSPKDEEGYITLTTHNAIAHGINNERLQKVKGKTHSFTAEVIGQFPEYSYPTEFKLSLKKGAQVMFVKNDSTPEKRFFNGKIGIVSAIDDQFISVKCKGESEPIIVEKAIWQNINYSINEETKEIEETVIGSFDQYPLRLAWAITVHKSQGLTFEKAIIDVQAAFAHGQIYVALSRCKSMEGLVLSSDISTKGIICDQQVKTFTRELEKNPPDEQIFKESLIAYQLSLLNELFDYKSIHYSLGRCLKIIQENMNSIQGNISSVLSDIQNNCTSELIEVSNKFSHQIQQHLTIENNIEANILLQERIKKACIYFQKNLTDNIQTPLDQCSFVTDNKAIQKSVNEILTKIREKLSIKVTCMTSCSDGFIIKDYIAVRAKAVLQKANTKTRKATDYADIPLEHPELFRNLREWREKTAHESNVPIFYVASQKVLIQISELLPRTDKELLAVKGMGQKKLKQYGKEILSIVLDYRNKKKGASGNI
ncbi:MAG: HRDC domain-containing protein [Bacteroidota bacterium]|nr:HRDC domain-containing protein [Bacteroidota bacterium]